MDIRAVIRDLEEIAPPMEPKEMDKGRIGLVIEGTHEIDRVACALDATQAVISASVRSGADMLVVHHTPLWTPVTTVPRPLAAILKPVLSADLNVYVMHTNFDHASGESTTPWPNCSGSLGCKDESWGLRRLQP